MKTLLIIPAFNVSMSLFSVISKLETYRKNLIIINDGSTDHTDEVIRSSGVSYIKHPTNMGMGAALKTGIKFGLSNDFSHAIFIDGDGQHDTSYIEPLIKMFDNYDYVFGNRFSKQGFTPSCKMASNLLGALVINHCFNSNLQDVSCGFRGIKLSENLLDICGNGYDFVFHQLFYVLKNNFRYSTLAIPCLYHANELWGTRRSELLAYLTCPDIG